MRVKAETSRAKASPFFKPIFLLSPFFKFPSSLDMAAPAHAAIFQPLPFRVICVLCVVERISIRGFQCHPDVFLRSRGPFQKQYFFVSRLDTQPTIS
jgi:hypothetical protein